MIRRIKKKVQDQFQKFSSINAANIAASMCNHEAFGDLKNIYKGREVVVCGAGPSLMKYQPIEGAIHIALNRALLYDKVKYDYFIADDWDGINFFQKELMEYDCKKYMGYHFGNQNFREIPESFRLATNSIKFYTDSYIFPTQEKSKLILDIDKMAISNQFNMGLCVMQIVFFMNPSKIYLVGIDASSNGHFTNKGLDKERADKIDKDLKQFVDISVLKEKWEDVKRFGEVYYPDTEIVSINPVGLKGMFKDVYQDSSMI